MSKKIMLLALAVASLAALAVPSMAMAVEEDIPLHVVPKPEKPSTITGGASSLTTKNNTISCEEVNGTATWESSTTGTISLTFGKDCKSPILGTCGNETSAPENGIITVGPLPFHLVTVPTLKPAVLITPVGGVFAKFSCGTGIFTTNIEVKGNGIIGTITAPECGKSSKSATISFTSKEPGVQNHMTVSSMGNPERTTTPTTYDLTALGETASMDAVGTITFPEGEKKLECT